MTYQERSGGHNQVVIAIEIDHGRRLDALLHLCGAGIERRLEPDVELGVERNHPPSRGARHAVVAVVGLLDEPIDAFAKLARLAVRDALTLALLDTQIGKIVLEIPELPFEAIPFAGAETVGA